MRQEKLSASGIVEHQERRHLLETMPRNMMGALLFSLLACSFPTTLCSSVLAGRLGTLNRGYDTMSAPGGVLRRLRVALDTQPQSQEEVAPSLAASVLSEDWSSLQNRVSPEHLGYQVTLGQLRATPKPLSCRPTCVHQARRLGTKTTLPVSNCDNGFKFQPGLRNVPSQPFFEAGTETSDEAEVQPYPHEVGASNHREPSTWILDTEMLEQISASLAAPSKQNRDDSVPGFIGLCKLVGAFGVKAAAAGCSLVKQVQGVAMSQKNMFVQELLQSCVTVAAAYAPGLGIPRAVPLVLSLCRTLDARLNQHPPHDSIPALHPQEGMSGGRVAPLVWEAAAWLVLGSSNTRPRPVTEPAALLGIGQRAFGQNVCRRLVEEGASRCRTGAAVLNAGLLALSLLGCKLVGGRYTTNGRDLHVTGCFCQGLDDPGGFRNPLPGVFFGRGEELSVGHAALDVPFCAVDILLGVQGIASASARLAARDPEVRAMAERGGLLEGHSLGTMDVQLVRERVGWAGEMVLYAPPPTVGWEAGVHSVCMDRDPICGGPLAKVLSIGTHVIRVRRAEEPLVHARTVYRGEVQGQAGDDPEGLAELAAIISAASTRKGNRDHLSNLMSALPLGPLTSVGRPLLAWAGPMVALAGGKE